MDAHAGRESRLGGVADVNREAAERAAATVQKRYPSADVTVTGGSRIDVRDGGVFSLRLTVGDENSPLLSLFGAFPPEPTGFARIRDAARQGLSRAVRSLGGKVMNSGQMRLYMSSSSRTDLCTREAVWQGTSAAVPCASGAWPVVAAASRRAVLSTASTSPDPGTPLPAPDRDRSGPALRSSSFLLSGLSTAACCGRIS
jgi:hypothetical protein